MKITGLEIDGYGVWTGLKLEGLCDGLSVLYGPNEAGKTTLLQFIRSALYGFAPGRQSFLPPLRGGRPGGSVDLDGPGGLFRLSRHEDEAGQGGTQGQIALLAADGTLQGEHLLKTLLCNVDEATFNNVFAVGLREIQQLGTLEDTQAAEMLYGLSAGLDRVSLVEVLRELRTSRSRILQAGAGPSQVSELLRQREELRLRIEELGKSTRRYGRLAAEQDRLQQEVARLEQQKRQMDREARTMELAIALRDRWDRRAGLDEELAALGPSATMPPGAVDRLDALDARWKTHRELAEQAQRQARQMRAEAAGLDINEALWRQGGRIEALLEQRPWITALRSQAGELATEIDELESTLAAQQRQLGLAEQMAPEALAAISAVSISRLRAPARQMRRCRGRLAESQQQAAAATGNAETLADELAAALAQRGQNDLAAALEQTGSLVGQLRRRVQIDQRLDQMTLCQRELEEQSRGLLDRQLLPVWVLLVLGGVFVLGVVLVMAGLFMPESITGSVGWAMALLGLAGSGAAGLGKVLLERANARQLEGCQRQINMLQLQLRETKEERDALDGQLSRGGGPIASRLQAAEAELAALEELVPLDSRRAAARQEAEAAAGRVARASEQLAAAHGQWRETLAAAGLPASLTPKQLRTLLERCEQIGQVHRRLEDRREESRRRHGELGSMLARITQLVAESQAAVSSPDPVEQLAELGEAFREQQQRIERRRELGRQARQLRRRQQKHQRAMSRLRHRRRELFRQAGAEDEQQFRRRAVEAARAELLRRQREELSREIASAIGATCSEDALREQLNARGQTSPEARRDQLLQRLTQLDEELKGRLEHRGRLAEQLKALAENHELAEKRLELATLQQRLNEAVARWQVLAVTNRVLDAIRTEYEQHRQPETLQEASTYLYRLTGGRYRRVWTPLGEEALKVDDAAGNSLPVEVLSRGTREQLFLSLRLALAACYARRNAPLPLVLDDVLVNFDAGRARAAVGVLRDFAAAGHQVLVFTCHEHIVKLFRALRVPVSRLPESAQASRSAVTFEELPQKEPVKKNARQGRKTSRTPVRPAAKQKTEAENRPPADDEGLWDDQQPAEIAQVDDRSDEDEEGFGEENEYQWEEADKASEDDGHEDDRYEDRGTAEAA